MRCNNILIISVLLLIPLQIFTAELDVNGALYGLVQFDNTKGGGLESGSVSGDGDQKFYWDGALDIQFTLSTTEDVGLISTIRFDRVLMSNTAKSDFPNRWRGIYSQEHNIAGVGNLGAGLASAYVALTDLPLSKITSIGLMEWRMGHSGWYNAYHSRLYSPSNIAYYHPYGTVTDFAIGSVGISSAFGIEDNDKTIVGTTVNFSNMLTMTFFTDNSTSDLYTLFMNRFASNMPKYWHAVMRRDGELPNDGPYYSKGFLSTIHIGTELFLPLSNGITIYNLFAFHNYKDEERSEGLITGGKWITIYPEVTIPLFVNIIGGMKLNYFKFNKSDTFGINKDSTMDISLFAGAEYLLNKSSSISFLWELIYPHTSAVDDVTTYINEDVNFHHTFTPSFNLTISDNIELISYYGYSMWDPSYDNPDTSIKENRQMIIGSLLKGSF